ncbi:MAG: IS4 family transposase [Chitinophagales bacterium]
MKLEVSEIKSTIAKLDLNSGAKSTEFTKRRGGKIDGDSFVLSFFLMVFSGTNTVLSWAMFLCKVTGESITAQAVQKKLQFRQLKFAEWILAQSLRKSLITNEVSELSTKLFSTFKRVFTQDSTCVKVPPNLSEFFPSSYSHGKITATARIQLIMDLLTGTYQHLSVNSFRDNDQKASVDILPYLQEGDLVLRDLGYWSLRVFQQIIKTGAYVLSRYKFGVTIFDSQTNIELDLLSELKLAKSKNISKLDRRVRLGKKNPIEVRLIAIELPEDVVNERRRKVKQDRNRRNNHSKEYLELLGWCIFITNVEEEVWAAEQVAEAYTMRWRIEIIFKCWKSKFNFAHLFEKKQSMTPARALISFYLLLAFLTLFFVRWYDYFLNKVYQATGRIISIFKFADFVKTFFDELMQSNDLAVLVKNVASFCKQDKRRRLSQLELFYKTEYQLVI